MDVILVSLWIILSFLVAGLGSTRRIGFFWALVLSLLLSPLIGLLLVFLLDDNKADREEREKATHTIPPVEELAKWKTLLDEKAITQEEYDQQKQRILNK